MPGDLPDVVVYTIVLKEGYQQYDTVVGSITTKVKGVATLNGTVYDVYDLQTPAGTNAPRKLRA